MFNFWCPFFFCCKSFKLMCAMLPSKSKVVVVIIIIIVIDLLNAGPLPPPPPPVYHESLFLSSTNFNFIFPRLKNYARINNVKEK